MPSKFFPAKQFAQALLGAALLFCAGCQPDSKLPEISTRDYAAAVAAFHSGLAALQVGDDVHAEKKLADLTKLAPGEPAGWANWGVLAMRQRNFDVARTRLERARDLAPRNGLVYRLLGILESNRGRSEQAIAELGKAVELDPRDLRGWFALAQEIERHGGADSDTQVQRAIAKILEARPRNSAALLELARIAAKRGDGAALKTAMAQLRGLSTTWPPEALGQFSELAAAVDAADMRSAATRTTLLRNVLLRDPEFRESLALIKAPPGEEAQPFTHFLRMETPAVKPAGADQALTFEVAPVAAASDGRWSWTGAIDLGAGHTPVVAFGNGHELRLANGATLPFPGGASDVPPTPEGVLQLDFNYDFKTDLVLAGAGGVRLFRQQSPDAFIDVTGDARLPQQLIDGRYTGAWAADIELDGDLDIVLGSSEGAPVVLRNNGDGTFKPIDVFPNVSGIRQFVWADLDGDGTPDVALIDGSGRAHVFINARQGQFRECALPADLTEVRAIAVADMNNDGLLDLLAVKRDGAIVRMSMKDEGAAWDVVEIARVRDAADYLRNDVRLHAADLDNNGALDLYLAPVSAAVAPASTTAQIWLGGEKNDLVPLERDMGPALVFDAADLDGNGRLDLVGLAADGGAVRGINRGSKVYHWQVVRARAAQAFGDQRINPFGVGGEIEIRAGSTVQKQPITGPQAHFGLGEATASDVIRVVWPNGAMRAEFDVRADQEIVTEQRLKGSCPFLFAFNGKEMAFVKDAVPWGSAIGLRINTLGSADIAATEEWYKIGRDELVPRDGTYDLRITAELWEVYYYDHVALVAVDHPPGTEIFVDERFVIPPAKLAITAVQTPRRIVRAIDDLGNDVTDIVATLDGRAVHSFGVGQYQGVTRDHYLEIDLGPDAPTSGPLYLIAHGSIYPTDSSINVAMTQGERWRARGLSLEVPDGRGGWVVARGNLGFPAGRKKTMLVNLTDVFLPGTARRVRLRTNLEIYWDQMEWAIGLPETELKTATMSPTVADLHYRGYSVISRPDAGSPELPDYSRLAGTKQRWRDLVGYYTRYGDVRELLAKVDDRYVIMNSGDEMSLRFAEQPPPAAGWLRDFVIVGDGWIKDGDYNSTFSRTVLPLPYHAQREYNTAPGRLEDEWVYRRYPDDWKNYHTRYVTADVFVNALRERASR